MSVSQTNRNLDDLHPTTKLKALCFLQECINEGLHIFITEGIRTLERQKRLYGYGRSASELEAIGIPGSYAKPGPQRTRTLTSNHMTGKAIDIAFKQEVHGSLYNQSNSMRERVGQIGEKHGFNRGGRRPAPQTDKPHFEDNGEEIDIGFYERIYIEEPTGDTFGRPEFAIEYLQGLPAEKRREEVIYLLKILCDRKDNKRDLPPTNS